MLKFQVSPEDDESHSKTEWTFTVTPELHVALVGYQEYERHDEYSPFFPNSRHWKYPDLIGVSTMEKPNVPDWVIADLKQFILLKLTLDFDLES